jgi:hypothetical protein
MPLSQQDKLALAMTSAGSMRNLAALVGVTHQKLGRWLRGDSPIPREATRSINLAFKIHSDIAKEQARVDGLPFDPFAPVLIQRPTLRDGTPGERVFIDRTQYIAPQLRDQIIGTAQQSRRFIQVSIRSNINLYSYIGTKTPPAAPLMSMLNRIERDSLAAPFLAREEAQPGSNLPAPLYTKYENISPGTDLRRSRKNWNQKLSKHSKHVGEKGTAFADQILLQLTPNRNADTPTQKPRSKRDMRRR